MYLLSIFTPCSSPVRECVFLSAQVGLLELKLQSLTRTSRVGADSPDQREAVRAEETDGRYQKRRWYYGARGIGEGRYACVRRDPCRLPPNIVRGAYSISKLSEAMAIRYG